MRQLRYHYILPVLLAAVLFTSCNILGPIALLFTPPKKIKPKYVLPEDGRLLILVKDNERLNDYARAKIKLAERTGEILKEKADVNQVIDFRELVNLQLSIPNYDSLSELDIGKQSQARTVLVIYVDRFTLQDRQHAPMWYCQFNVRVKVIGVTENKLLWPELNDDGETLRITVRPKAGKFSDTSYRAQYADEAISEMASQIAKLFYEYEVDPVKLPETDTFEVES